MKRKNKGKALTSLACIFLVLCLGLCGCTRSSSESGSYVAMEAKSANGINSYAMNTARSYDSMDMDMAGDYYLEDNLEISQDSSLAVLPDSEITEDILPVSEEDIAEDEEFLAHEPETEKEADTVQDADTVQEPEPEQKQEQEPQKKPASLEEKLVYTGNVTVETLNFKQTLESIKNKVRELGGFIESESQNDSSYGWYMENYEKSSSLTANLQVRIPSKAFYSFLDGMESDGSKVTSRSVYVENISRTYSETATQIESLEIQQQRLLDMMRDASRVSDLLEIEARLSEVQNSLKIYKNNLSMMDTNVAFSTVSIYLREVGIYSEPDATTLGEKLVEAFQDAVENFKKDLSAFTIWFVRNFFNILVFLLCLFVAVRFLQFLFLRRRRRVYEPGQGKSPRRRGRGRKKDFGKESFQEEELPPAEKKEEVTENP